jgi:hypothetical protein
LQAALDAEVTEYLERQKHARQAAGAEFRGYRNGVGKERSLTVGSGTIQVQVPRVSDVPAGQEPFVSDLGQPYQRRSKSLDEVFPQLFLEGLATRDFEPALRSLLGAKATLSPSTIVRLNQQFKGEYEDWTREQFECRADLLSVGGRHLCESRDWHGTRVFIDRARGRHDGAETFAGLERRLPGVKGKLVGSAATTQGTRDE